jgi:hypothetical protein
MEVAEFHAAQENGQIVLKWAWPDGCTRVEIVPSQAPECRADEQRTPLVVLRHDLEKSGSARLSIEGLTPGRGTFCVRCIIEGGGPNRVAGPGRSVDVLVSRAREIRWKLTRCLGFGSPQLVVQADDLSLIDRMRLVGRVNERPVSPDDGHCFLDWHRPAGQIDAGRLVLTFKARRDPRGETFCRLFVEPAELIRVDDPLVDQTIL